MGATAGMTLAVNPDGEYTLKVAHPAWTFAGTVGRSLQGLTARAGRDRIGDYRAIAFLYGAPNTVRAEIRLYKTRSIVLFTLRYLMPGAAPRRFPILTT